MDHFLDPVCTSVLYFKFKSALSSGDITSFKQLVKDVDVNATYGDNSTLLHEAVQIGKHEFVEFLLQNQAIVNITNKDHRTPLHIACRGGLQDIVTTLLNYGADVNAKTLDQQTPLHIAAWRGKDEIAKLLVSCEADVNAYDKDGHLPLHWAVRSSNSEMVEYFFEHGSHIDALIGKAKRSPFLIAVIEQKYTIAQILLTHGADPSYRQKATYLLESIMKDSQLKIPTKLKAIHILVKCGIECSEADLVNCSNVLTSEEERNDFLRDCKTDDMSLYRLCRIEIRRHLMECCHGQSIYQCVQLLPIPNLLKEYLTFQGDYKIF